MGVNIEISTPVYPTEDVEKIKSAILKIFPDAVFQEEREIIKAESRSFDEFAKILKELHIRDAARAVFLRSINENCMTFSINKQVATTGKISFSVGDAPLGDIRVEVCSQDIRALIEWAAPDTRVQK